MPDQKHNPNKAKRRPPTSGSSGDRMQAHSHRLSDKDRTESYRRPTGILNDKDVKKLSKKLSPAGAKRLATDRAVEHVVRRGESKTTRPDELAYRKASAKRRASKKKK